MKKKRLLFNITAILIVSSNSYSLGGIEIMTNITPSAPSNLAQQAIISPEAVYYNPATSAFLEDGTHLYYGGYMVFTDYKTKISLANSSDEINTDSPQPLPSFSYIYKKDKIAYYFGVASLGQGGFLTYSADDINVLNDLDINLVYPGAIFGASYQIDNKTSLSLGGVSFMLEPT